MRLPRSAPRKRNLRMLGSRQSPRKSLAEHLSNGAFALASALVVAGLAGDARAESGLRPYMIVGDAIAASLTGAKGDPARGRAIVANRQVGLWLLCHSGPFPETRFQGTMAPDLKGAGSRSNEGQLRLRIVDASRLNPETIMPPYYRTEGLTRAPPPLPGS